MVTEDADSSHRRIQQGKHKHSLVKTEFLK